MARPEPQERGSLLEAAGELSRRAFRDDVPRGHAAVERERLRLAVMRGRPPRSRAAAFWIAAAAVALCCAVAAFFFVPRRLDFVVKSASGEGDGYLDAAANHEASARFSDGTGVTVAPGGRARIASVDRHGARIALEHGRAELHVVHRPGASWAVDAGPFTIAVTGTKFDVDWAGATGQLAVSLHVGSVIVRGPLSEGGIALRAGQRLLANVQERTLRIEELAAKPEVADAPELADAPPAANEDAAKLPEERAPSEEPVAKRSLARGDVAPREATPRSDLPWSARVAAGDFASVLAEAEDRGIDSTLAHAPSRDLVALSDAARYKGKAELARRALGAIRTRFPASVDAKNAVFHLGRLSEGRGALDEALAEYDRYLSESRSGAFAAEAFGRKLIVTRKAAGDDKARSVARDYLARFPNGPYARTAKELLGSP